MESLKFLAPALAVVALLFAFYKIAFVSKQDAGTERMKEIAAAINDGAKAFLFAEYKILAAAGSPHFASCSVLCSPSLQATSA